MIEVSRLKKNFGTTQALRGIDFEVHANEVVGFLGPNGAGKTTTMRILTGFFPPDEGKVTVGGYDLQEHSLQAKQKIGYLPENNPLWEDLEVTESLRYHAKLRRVPSRQIQFQIKKVIHLCGLKEVIGRKIGELSKGYQQRVGLAQTLVHDPEILILDEPTSGLDPHQIIEIRNLILEIGQQKTVLLSSHILPEVEATCERIIIIHQGNIVGSGTPAELEAKAKGGSFYRAQIRGNRNEIEKGLKDFLPLAEIVWEVSNADLHSFTLSSADSNHWGEKIFQAVVRNGWSMSELKKEETSLEEVFLKLTNPPHPPLPKGGEGGF
jgi:ABC-2 type transport system ATP-binding protein